MSYEIERLYHRRKDIHAAHGGQQQGGISTPPKTPYIFLFTGEAGEQHGYSDGFEENGVFIYTGEGQRGDMEFMRGNKAIRDHALNGKDLLLFEATKRKGLYRFKGSFACAGYDDSQTGPDTDGSIRKLIRFQLVPLSAISEADVTPDEKNTGEQQRMEGISKLRKKAYDAGSVQATKDVAVSKRSLYRRSLAVKNYVLVRANGICECCKKPAPFKKRNGEPYLEPHHIRQLSDDGLDSPAWVAAICPTCHREIHHGEKGETINKQLEGNIQALEKN
jgi:5-methylcytosine-specific restriction enzyme A